ncbi:MAG: hypothetical protein LUC90_09550 [Lachnospiraceae bacterium]|nr:hypothetical protein [Lachnospiraceae bacterium]
MAKLRMEFTFDEEALRRNGYGKEQLYDIVKSDYEKNGLKCISDDDVLAFADQGSRWDYGNMWAITLAFLECEWFADSLLSCLYFQNDLAEDLLPQLPRMREILERNRRRRTLKAHER